MGKIPISHRKMEIPCRDNLECPNIWNLSIHEAGKHHRARPETQKNPQKPNQKPQKLPGWGRVVCQGRAGGHQRALSPADRDREGSEGYPDIPALHPHLGVRHRKKTVFLK